MKFLCGMLLMWACVTLAIFVAEFLDLDKNPSWIKNLAGFLCLPAAIIYTIYKMFVGVFSPVGTEQLYRYKRYFKVKNLFGNFYLMFNEKADWTEAISIFRVV